MNKDVVARFLDRCRRPTVWCNPWTCRYKREKGAPDLVIILSALWDINRWGPRSHL